MLHLVRFISSPNYSPFLLCFNLNGCVLVLHCFCFVLHVFVYFGSNSDGFSGLCCDLNEFGVLTGLEILELSWGFKVLVIGAGAFMEIDVSPVGTVCTEMGCKRKRFLDLSSVLEPGKPAKTDKSAILSDAIHVLNQLRTEAEELKDKNEKLQEDIKSLKGKFYPDDSCKKKMKTFVHALKKELNYPIVLMKSFISLVGHILLSWKCLHDLNICMCYNMNTITFRAFRVFYVSKIINI
ncbi:hypothetical protein L1049_001219 [Liquidambar formosana]|uniref:Uncharacterized protein n=1 Tax=Liquidambar formosana TaxID=63359 RepID=A0AAP0R5D2_LIQFO